MPTFFKTRTYGKWILAGEHAVLRGAPALVFPVSSCYMEFSHQPSQGEFEVQFSGPYGADFELLFWGVVERALHQVGRSRKNLLGSLTIESHLPVGAGLGASAAVCVGIGRLWQHFGWIAEQDLYDFARELENLFHGESSGVDIAVAIAGEGIRFMRGGEWSTIKMNWRPQWYLSYSGKRGVTSECVQKVKDLSSKSPELFEKIDRQMADAVEMAQKALSLTESEGLPMLEDAIDRARACFDQWDLCGRELTKHMKWLTEMGASAVKPTGSGGGGYVLSLWHKAPPEEANPRLTI